MRYLRILAVLAVLGVFLIPAASTQAQGFSVGIGVGPVAVGVGPAYVGVPPVCAYGYYPFAPYACAPYGYYSPDYFVNGIFIGAGSWFHGFYGHQVVVGRPGFWGRPGFAGRPGPIVHGPIVAPRAPAGNFHGAPAAHGGFHGGGNFHSGGGRR